MNFRERQKISADWRKTSCEMTWSFSFMVFNFNLHLSSSTCVSNLKNGFHHHICHSVTSGIVNMGSSSCLSNFVCCYDKFTHLIDERKVVDFRKAFHIVPHSILLNKRSKSKTNRFTLRWAPELNKSHIANRATSGWQSVTNAAPQGSVLGPVQFNILLVI